MLRGISEYIAFCCTEIQPLQLASLHHFTAAEFSAGKII
jgi:hypothetical protein